MQDYPAVEHIIIDGASVDGTLEIIKEYPHLTWLSEPDRGQSHALNKGFRMAQGEIIGWLNADDTYRPGAISKAVKCFQTNPQFDILYTDVQVIDENDQPIRLAKAEPFSLERLLISNIIKQPTVFMRRKVLDRLGGVNEKLNFVMDREFWLRAGMLFNLQYIPDEIFANFRYCKGTKSHESVLDFHREWIDVLDEYGKSSDSNKPFLTTIAQAKQATLRQYYFCKGCKFVHDRQ